MICFYWLTHRSRVSRGRGVDLIHLFQLRIFGKEQMFSRMSDNCVSYLCRCNELPLNLVVKATHIYYLVFLWRRNLSVSQLSPLAQGLWCWGYSWDYSHLKARQEMSLFPASLRRLLAGCSSSLAPSQRLPFSAGQFIIWQLASTSVSKRANKTQARVFCNLILEATSRFYSMKNVPGSNPHSKGGKQTKTGILGDEDPWGSSQELPAKLMEGRVNLYHFLFNPLTVIKRKGSKINH